MLFKRYCLLIFDLDGTLIDSARDIANAANYARQKMGLTPKPLSAISAYVGRGVLRLLERTFDSEEQEFLEEAQEYFFEHYEENLLAHTKLYPNCEEFLNKFSHLKMAVLTNKPQGFSEKILNGLDIHQFFEGVIGGDTSHGKKPKPDGLNALIKRHQVETVATCFLGDSLVDYDTAINAGVTPILLTHGFMDRAQLEHAQTQHIYDSFADILDSHD